MEVVFSGWTWYTDDPILCKKDYFLRGECFIFNVIVYLLIDVFNCLFCPVCIWLHIPLILLFSYIVMIMTVVGRRVLRDSNQGE